MELNASKVADWIFKLVAVLVIPLIGWAYYLHGDVSVAQVTIDSQGSAIESLEGKVETLQEKVTTQGTKIKALEKDSERVRANEKTLVRLETEMKNANKKLDEIIDALNK